MKKSILTLSLLIGLIYGCNNTAKDTVQSTENNQTPSQPATEEHHHDEHAAIELNNGTKWKVAPDMLEYIRTMEADVNQFSENEPKNLEDFTKLGTGLQKNIDLLTSNCTMEGKAHDELHKWLLPYIDMVSNLNNSKNNDEALHNFKEIKSSYNTFNSFFE